MRAFAKLLFVPVPILSSRAHPFVKIARSLHGAKGRREQGLFLIEGHNAVEAALASDWAIREFFALPDENELSTQARKRGLQVRRASGEFLAALCDSQSAPAVVAFGILPPVVENFDLDAGLLIVMDGISDPGNVGTILRAADALGARKVICCDGTADVWGPKVVRSAAGSLFALPPISLRDRSVGHIARLVQTKNCGVVRADAHGETAIQNVKWPSRCALVLGHETRGVSAEFVGQSVTIPLAGRAESLNVAMAATVFLWERARALSTKTL